MKTSTPTRICCRVAGIAVGGMIGGPLVAAFGDQLGQVAHDLFGDVLGDQEELAQNIGGMLTELSPNIFSPLPPKSDSTFNHDFRRALIQALAVALKDNVLSQFALLSQPDLSNADRARAERLFRALSVELSKSAQQAVKKNDSDLFESLFPRLAEDTHLLDLQDNARNSLPESSRLFEQWFDRVLLPLIKNKDDYQALASQANFKRFALEAIAMEFPPAFVEVLKKPEHERMRLATSHLMMNQVRATVQALPVQIKGLETKIDAVIQRFANDAELVMRVDASLAQLGGQLGRLEAATARIEERLSGNEEKDKYEAEYRAAVKANLDHMELFGADLKPNQKKHKLLSVAYVSLNLQRQEKSGAETTFSTEDLLDTLQPENGRILIQGDAGSGKSTLFRWVAIGAAEEFIPDPLKSNRFAEEFLRRRKAVLINEYWRMKIPFLLRLRDCPNGLLPKPEDFPAHISTAIGNPPAQWVKSVLDAKRGLILLDGIDEIPHQHRDALRSSVEDYLTRYEGNFFLMSARPAAVRDWDEWFQGLKFRSATINPMTEGDKAQLIQQWHKAVAQTLSDAGEDASALEGYGTELIAKLKKLPTVSQLAVYPLLCAMICALHYWRDKELPQSYWELCEDLCAMLLHRRDKESKVRLEEFPTCYAQLDYGHKRRLVQHVAMKMAEPQVVSSIERDVVLGLAQEMLKIVPQRKAEEADELVDCLIERSGILREPSVGNVDFIHNTFKEFLAADWLVTKNQTATLLQNATNPDWEKIILFAAGANDEQIASHLITRLLEAGGHANHLLAIRCRAMARYLDATLETKLDEIEKTLFPPRKMADAEALATLGNPVVDYLKYNRKHRVAEAAACIRTLRLIGTPEAAEVLEGYLSDGRWSLIPELVQAVNPLRIYLIRQRFLSEGRIEGGMERYVTDLGPINNPDCLAELKKLQNLYLHSTQVSDVTPLSALTKLQTLHLHGTGVIDVTPLSALTNLRELYLHSTQVSDVTPLSALTNLQTLDLRGTDVSDVTPLSALTKLQTLNLSSTQVIDVTPLSALADLRELYLSSPQVSDVTPLSALADLRELYLSSTQVIDVTPLSALTKLLYLWLSEGMKGKVRGVELLKTKARWL